MRKNPTSDSNRKQFSLFPSFKKVFAHTFLIRGINVIIGLLASIILARALGPAGRGGLALFVVTIQILLPLGTLVYGSNSILMGEDRARKSRLMLQTFLFICLVSCIILLVISVLAPSTRAVFLGSGHLFMVWLLVGLLWFNMMEIGLRELLLARQDFFMINYTRLSSSLLYLLILFVCLWVLDLGIKTAIIGLICQQFLMVIVYLWELILQDETHIDLSWFRIDYHLIKKSLTINKRTFLAGIPTLLLLKVDMWIMGIFATHYAVGIYQIAVTACMMIMILGEITNQIAKGKAVSEQHNRVIKSSLLASKLIFIAGIFGYIFILFFGKDLLGLIYGQAFRPSYQPLLVLFIATIIWGGTMPLLGFLVGRYKYPRTVVIGMNVAMILNIGLNIWLIPIFVEVGAAMASLVAYLFMSVIFVREFKKRTGVQYRDFVSFSKRELSWLKKQVTIRWR